MALCVLGGRVALSVLGGRVALSVLCGRLSFSVLRGLVPLSVLGDPWCLGGRGLFVGMLVRNDCYIMC